MKHFTNLLKRYFLTSLFTLAMFSLSAQQWTAPTGHPNGGQWTFFTAKAQIDGVDMVAGDQLAIFDGAKLVGAFTLTQACNEVNMYGNQWIAYEKLDNNGSPVQGYTPGNAYTFKAWKASTNTVYANYSLSWNTLVGNGHEHSVFPPTNTYTWDYPELSFFSAPGSIDGYVKELGGANPPIEGASVTIVESGQQTTTDPAGYYQFPTVVAGTYKLAYAAAGYGNDMVTGVTVASNGSTTVPDVLLTSPPGSISGVVSNSDGPIEGASVTTNPGGYSTTTDEVGIYELENIPAGTYNVTASADYHDSDIESVVVVSEENSEQDFELDKTNGSLKVVVKNATDGDPIENADVSLTPGGVQSTDVDGIVWFNNLDAGIYLIEVTKAGFEAANHTATVADGYLTTSSVFMLTDGTVINYPQAYTDFIGGNPNEDVWTLYIRNITHEGEPLLPYDAIGVYDGVKLVGVGYLNEIATAANEFTNFVSVFSELNDGSPGYQHGNEYTIEIFRHLDEELYYGSPVLTDPYSNGAYIGNTFPYGDNRYSFVSMELEPGPGEVKGRARIAYSSPHVYLEGVEVTAVETTTSQTYTATTGSDGRYTLSSMEPGTYDITAAKYSYTFNAYSDWVVAPHSSSTGRNFAGHPVPTLTQTINLNSGFQFVSSRIEETDMEMETLLPAIHDDLLFVKNTAGAFYHKPGPDWVDNIGEWKNKEGYLFNMSAATTLTFSGIQLAADTPIPLHSGYQFISYLPEFPINAQTALVSILDNMEYVRNSAGAYLRKVGGNWVNNIGTMKPGEGYLVKMHAADVLVYPAPAVATLTTDAATAVTMTEATTGGNITANGGSAITSRGVVYGTSAEPTLLDQVVNSGTGTGTFTANLTGLYPGTTYYARAFATNAAGTAYGDEITFDTDPLVITRVQYKTSTSNVNNASATFDAAPSEGNLLVAISFHRFDGETPQISGTGWELRELNLHATPNSGAYTNQERRGLAVWTKTAGPTEPATVTTSWDVASDNSLIIMEFTGAGSFDFDVSASNNSAGTSVSDLSTGTTAATATSNSLVIGVLGARDDGNNMGTPNWSNGLADNIAATGNIRALHAAFAVDQVQGTKVSTADWSNAKQATAAIVVFSLNP